MYKTSWFDAVEIHDEPKARKESFKYKDKVPTHVLPSLHGRVVWAGGCAGLVEVEVEDQVDIVGELGHGGEDEHHRGHHHHAHRGERVQLTFTSFRQDNDPEGTSESTLK